MTDMQTIFLLAAQFNGAAVVPLDKVRESFFPHITVDKLVWKANRGEIDLPIVYLEGSAKSAKGVALQDLATYLDRRRAAALKEYEQLHGEPFTRAAG